MVRIVVFLFLLFIAPQSGFADAFADCSQTKDLDRRISGCTERIKSIRIKEGSIINENLAAAYGARGWALRKKGRHKSAIADLSEAIRWYPGNTGAHLNRALSYEAIGLREKAVADYHATVELGYRETGVQAEQAEMAAEALVRLGVKVPLKKRSSAYQRKVMREARRPKTSYDGGWKFADDETADKRKPAKAQIEKAESDFKQGVELRKKGSFDKAIEFHTAALQRFPTTPEHRSRRAEAYLDRGRAHFGKKQYDLAIADYTEVLRLDPNNAMALSDRGAMYFNKGLNAKAIGDLTESIRIAPRDPAPHVNLGIVYGAMGRNGEAIAEYSTAIRLNPRMAQAYNGRAWNYFKMGKAAKGLPDAKKAIELKPKFAAAYDTRGHIYEAIGEKQKAISDFRKAYQLEPTNKKRKEPLMRLGALPHDKTAKKVVPEADQMELAFWNDVKNSSDPEMLQAYLDEFPNGTFARLARIKLGKLKKAR